MSKDSLERSFTIQQIGEVLGRIANAEKSGQPQLKPGIQEPVLSPAELRAYRLGVLATAAFFLGEERFGIPRVATGQEVANPSAQIIESLDALLGNLGYTKPQSPHYARFRGVPEEGE